MRFAAVAAALTSLRLSRNVGPVSAVVAVLSGFGAVAFAVAPLAAIEESVPAQRVVIEELANDATKLQTEALAGQDIELRRTGLTRQGDSVAAVLRRLGAQDLQAVAALSRDETLRDALGGGAGRLVQLRMSRLGQLTELSVLYPSAEPAKARSHFERLSSTRADSGWYSRVETLPFSMQMRRAAGKVSSSFRAAAQEAGLPAGVAAQMSELLGAEASAPREPRKGETFSVVYEAPLVDGEAVSWAEGRVLAAEVSGVGAPLQVLWFQEPGNAGAYYDGKGKPKPQGFMTAPLEFDRVTSGFELRMDPILRRQMAHQGVDYGAPLGTPVFSVAPGVVEFAGRQSGYGNVVEVRHSAERTTLYAHLSRIDVAQGDAVGKGKMIGAVGRTGWATGPHLHFEYRVAGVHQDPQLATRTLEQAALGPAARRQFEQVARGVRAELAAAQAVGSRRARFE